MFLIERSNTTYLTTDIVLEESYKDIYEQAQEYNNIALECSKLEHKELLENNNILSEGIVSTVFQKLKEFSLKVIEAFKKFIAQVKQLWNKLIAKLKSFFIKKKEPIEKLDNFSKTPKGKSIWKKLLIATGVLAAIATAIYLLFKRKNDIKNGVSTAAKGIESGNSDEIKKGNKIIKDAIDDSKKNSKNIAVTPKDIEKLSDEIDTTILDPIDKSLDKAKENLNNPSTQKTQEDIKEYNTSINELKKTVNEEVKTIDEAIEEALPTLVEYQKAVDKEYEDLYKNREKYTTLMDQNNNVAQQIDNNYETQRQKLFEKERELKHQLMTSTNENDKNRLKKMIKDINNEQNILDTERNKKYQQLHKELEKQTKQIQIDTLKQYKDRNYSMLPAQEKYKNEVDKLLPNNEKIELDKYNKEYRKLIDELIDGKLSYDEFSAKLIDLSKDYEKKFPTAHKIAKAQVEYNEKHK